MTTLADLVADPRRVAQVQPEDVPALLVQLAAIQTALAARLAAPRPETVNGAEDRLLTIDEAAARLSVTRDWLRHRPDLPFVRKLSAGVVRYSATGISAHLAAGRPRPR